MLWAWIPVVALGLAAGEEGAPADALYVQVSMMNVRAEAGKGAEIVEKLVIGTQVSMAPVEGGEWCRVGTKEKPELGFAICTLAGSERPTLESVQAKLDAFGKKAGPPGNEAYHSRRYRDLIARKFFLSPSVLTIFEYNTAVYNSAFGDSSPPNNYESCRLDTLGRSLLAAYSGELHGTDMRPVARTWNRERPVTADLKSIGEVPKFNDPVLARFKPPPVRPSFFKGPDDAYVLGGGLEIGRLRRRDNPARSDGQAEAGYVVANLHSQTGTGLLEFLKLVTEAAPSASTAGPTNGRYGPFALGSVGSLELRYPDARPPVWIVTPQGISQGSLAMAKAMLGAVECCDIVPLARLAMPRPLDGRILVALVPTVPPPTGQSKFERIGRRSWTLDLDGDGVLDLAYLGGSFVSEIGDDIKNKGYYLMNVAGQWQVALESGEPECT